MVVNHADGGDTPAPSTDDEPKPTPKATATAQKLVLVFYDHSEDDLLVKEFDTQAEVAIFIANHITGDTPWAVVKGTRLLSSRQKNVVHVSIGGTEFKVTQGEADAEVV